MRHIALVLACLACLGDGGRVQSSRGRLLSDTQVDVDQSRNPLQALARLFLGLDPASAFNTLGARPGSRVHNPALAAPELFHGRANTRSTFPVMSASGGSGGFGFPEELRETVDEFSKLASSLKDRGLMHVGRTISLVLLGLLLSFGPASQAVGPAFAEPQAVVQREAIVQRVETMPEIRQLGEAGKQSEAGIFPGTSLLADASSSTKSPRREAGIFPATGLLADASSSTKSPSRSYINLTGFPFPLGPFLERKTVETELVKGRVYSFEQQIKLSGITANVRSTVFRMRDNHLLVYNPVAPTEEFLTQLNSLNHKGVSHIMLGATAYEHKIWVGPFARRFPDAKVWAVPDQWSFPLDLPSQAFGIDPKGSAGGDLIDTAKGSAAYSRAPDFTDEFEVKLLHPQKRLGFGYAANEAAVFHKDTKTLAITDALVNVPTKPTAIYDESDLLDIGDNARDSNTLGNLILKALGAVNWQGTGSQEVKDFYADSNVQGTTSTQIQRGWERNALLSLLFGPAPSTLIDPDRSFQQVAGKWIVAPVTDTLIYDSDRVKPELKRWIDDITTWDFNYISPSHFAAMPGTPDDVRKAFAPTFASTPAKAGAARLYPGGDARLLDDINSALKSLKVI